MSQTLKIRELRVRAVKVPMAQPHRTANGTITESPLVLTDVLTEEDIAGHSYFFMLYPNSARIRRPPLPNGAIRILPNG